MLFQNLIMIFFSLSDLSTAHDLLNANNKKAILISFSHLLNRMDFSTFSKTQMDGRELVYEKCLGFLIDNSLN